MRSPTVWSLLIVILAAARVFAQEEGELLLFDNAFNLDMRITDRHLKSSRDSLLYQSSPSAASREDFDRLLFNGLLPDEHLLLQARWLQPDSRWSDWQDVFMKIFQNGRFWAKFDLPGTTTRQIQYRLINRGMKAAGRVEIYAVEGIRLKQMFQQGETAPVFPQKTAFPGVDTIPEPPIVTREEWGANPPIGSYVPHDPFRLTQHHTAGRRVTTLAEGIAEMQFIQDFHQNGRGWQDIGYHFTVDDAGRIYQGVPVEFRGTHVGGNNTGNIGIAYLGNLHIAGELPTAAALESLVAMWSWLSFEYHINPDSLFGHRDYNATACPGDNLYSELPELRNSIRRELGLGAPYAANPFPQPFSREVSPNTNIQFTIRDEEEGVNAQSITVSVNNNPVSAEITGSGNEYQVFYNPSAPFPGSQNVIVDVEAADFADPPNVMHYSYRFTIAIDALYTEVETTGSMRNGLLELNGDWDTDFNDVNLGNLGSGQRFLAIDEDGSHVARIFPEVPETGDYRILMASNNNFLGESARYRLVNAAGAEHPHFVEYNSVYLRQWGLLSPTPVHFEAGNLPNGYIELSGLSAIPTRLVVDAFRLEKVDRLDPPSPPTLKWVRLKEAPANEIEVAWYPTLEGDIAGYRLYMSEDGRTWGDPLLDKKLLTADIHQYSLNYTGGSTTVYFRVVAVDTNKIINEGGSEDPLLSIPSDTYGVGLGGDQRILIVDNFDRLASWQKRYHPFVRSHGDALDANGFGFESCTETAVQNGDLQLNDYPVVVYFCGDDSRADESLAAADQYRLLQYLESGGKLFISGSEIGYDFDATTSVEKMRYENLLKAEYVGDLSGSNRVLGSEGTVFEGLDFIYGTSNSEDTYIEDYPDYIRPSGGSEVALFYDNLRIAGVQYTGRYGNSALTAQLVYLGFTFETIVDPADRAELMGRAMKFFGLITAISGGESTIPQRFELQQNYPNPFNPTTTVRYTIPGGQYNDRVLLEIFNVLGQKVRTLVDARQPAGVYTIQWDGRNDLGMPVASGVYILTLKSGEFKRSRRMTLLK